MAKKEKTPKRQSFDEWLKLYFSSMTARNACYLYLNVLKKPNTLVMSNTPYPVLGGYIPQTLSIHIIEFKDTDHYDEFLTLLDLPTQDPYVIHVGKFLKVANHRPKQTSLVCLYDKDDQMAVSTSDDNRDIEEIKQMAPERIIVEDDEDTDDLELDDDEDDGDEEGTDMTRSIETFTNEAICGSRMQDFRALIALEQILDDLIQLETKLTATTHRIYELPLLSGYLHSNIHTFEVSLADFRQEDGNAIFDSALPCQLLLVDGSDTVSMKEFVKKRKKQPELMVWVDDQSLKWVSRFEDEDVRITSARPFAYAVPVCRAYAR